MVSWIGFLYLFGTVPHIVSNTFKLFFEFTPALLVLSDVSRVLIQLTHGVNIAIYYYFNSMFRQILFDHIRNLKEIILNFILMRLK